jgi:hypothetical protein
MAMTGASLPIIGRSLGHRRSVTTEIYARLALDPVRVCVETAATAMLEAGGVVIEGHSTPITEGSSDE